MDLHFNKPRQEIFYRADGTPYMNKWLRVDPVSKTSSVERITMLDEHGAPYEVLLSNVELIQTYLDRLIGDDHAFLSVESRRSTGDPDLPAAEREARLRPAQPAHRAAVRRPEQRAGLAYKPMLDARDRTRAASS